MVGKTISHYNPETREKPNVWFLLLSTLLAVVVFLVDLSIPLGVAGGVPYVAVVLLSLWLPGKRYTILVATLCTGFTILGLYWSAPGGEIWKALANRFLAVFAIWVTATLSLQRKRAEEALRKAEKQLLHAQKMEALGNLTGGDCTRLQKLADGRYGLLPSCGRHPCLQRPSEKLYRGDHHSGGNRGRVHSPASDLQS